MRALVELILHSATSYIVSMFLFAGSVAGLIFLGHWLL